MCFITNSCTAVFAIGSIWIKSYKCPSIIKYVFFSSDVHLDGNILVFTIKY